MNQHHEQHKITHLARSPALPQVEMRRANQSAACYQAHAHDEFSFGVIDAGCARYTNGRQRHLVHTGMLVTINPGDIHACNPEQGIWSYRMLFIDTAWLNHLQDEMVGPIHGDFRPFRADYQTEERWYSDFSSLYQRLSSSNQPLAAETGLIEFLFPLLEGASNNEPDRYQCLPELTRATELIMDRLDENLTLEQLGNASGLGRYRLIRLFRKHYGLPPHAWQLDQRIRQARQLLKNTRLPLGEVALLLGFADQAHFQRHFRQRTALTPGQFQAFFR